VQVTSELPATFVARRRTKIGVVAGHWQNDSGAVCPDGLQEVHLNLDVASRVVAILQHEGFDAELLPEFSKKLDGYQASAFVSIHADTCEEIGLSGFKVARVAASAIPKAEDRLVACLIQEYGKATGLPFHQDSITYDMTDYHAFGEIAPDTPGAIIEMGFMNADRELLTEHSSELAQGVAQGILCFLGDY
jgi:N-acetylmuramoyl-L-alanine amidase